MNVFNPFDKANEAASEDLLQLLDYACGKNSQDSITIILESFRNNFHQKDEDILESAICHNCKNIVIYFIEKRHNLSNLSSEGDTPLITAIATNNFNIVNLLIQNKADVTQTIEGNYTPLMATLECWDNTRYWQSLAIFKTILKNTKEQGADIDTASMTTGETALSKACKDNNNRAINILVRAGAQNIGDLSQLDAQESDEEEDFLELPQEEDTLEEPSAKRRKLE